MDNMNEIEKIVYAYKQCESIKGTANKLNISMYRVRKVLTGEGIILNDIHRKILEYYSQGYSMEEIASMVNLSIAVTRSYLPPKRPIYKANRSANAIKIANWREKKKGKEQVRGWTKSDLLFLAHSNVNKS